LEAKRNRKQTKKPNDVNADEESAELLAAKKLLKDGIIDKT
jgi:hypothetical protein